MIPRIFWLVRLSGAILLTVGMATAVHAASLSLNDIMTQAEAQSPSLAESRALVDAAAGKARQAGLAINPVLTIDVENFAGSGVNRSFESAETTAGIEQTFELGGKRAARKALAAAELDIARLKFNMLQADLQRSLRMAYAAALAAEERLMLSRAANDRARALSRTAQSLVAAGREPPLRALRAEALVIESEATLTASETELRRARRELFFLAGMDQDAEFELVKGFDTIIAPTDLARLDKPLTQRFAEAELAAAQARVVQERSLATPDVTGLFGVRRFQESGTTALLAGISVPLPVRNRNQGGVAAAQSDLIAAQHRLTLAQMQSQRDVRNAQMALDAATRRSKAISESGLKQAEEALRLAQLGYQAGKFSLLDVLDAEAALNQIRDALVESQLVRVQAAADLARALAQ